MINTSTTISDYFKDLQKKSIKAQKKKWGDKYSEEMRRRRMEGLTRKR